MSALHLYNSRTRKKELFSAKDRHVGMYVCGITPYSVTHLGHAFTHTFFDVLKRVLMHDEYSVTYVQNLTDIDDDILKKAKEEKRNWRELGETNAQKFMEDSRWLGNADPDIYPRATDHIREIITFTRALLRRGRAYESNGNVYFEVRRDKQYGALSGLAKKKMLAVANARGNHPDDPNKKDPLDFVLWQARKNNEPSWHSPWGMGRPGWHIECSAMGEKYLGPVIDIHGGGGDLVFPHHESEEAQSRSARSRGKSSVRWWMHTGMLRYKREKMSKSLGNLILIADLKKRYSANAIRIYLLSHHYRSSYEFFESDMDKAEHTERLFTEVWRTESLSTGKSLQINKHRTAFYHALYDDMDTPRALHIMERMARDIIRERKKKNVTDAKAFLNQAYGILGLTLGYKIP